MRCMGYRKISHSTYDQKYHLVWITKYRKPVLKGEVGRRVRDLINQTCLQLDVQILSGAAGSRASVGVSAAVCLGE
jgi:putative transposase